MDPYPGKTEGEVLTVEHFQSTADKVCGQVGWRQLSSNPLAIMAHGVHRAIELWSVARSGLVTAPPERRQRPQVHTVHDTDW